MGATIYRMGAALRKSRDYSTLLIYAALGVTVPRYIGAFVASDVGQVTGWVSDALSVLMAVSGVGMGVLDILGMAYIFDGWRARLAQDFALYESIGG